MRKYLSVLLALVLLLGLCACGDDSNKGKEKTSKGSTTTKTTLSNHTHTFLDATCDSPKTCACGETAGVALGHQFAAATCTSPQICDRCGGVGEPELGHDFAAADCTIPQTCARCGRVEGEALGHDYVDTKCSRCGKTDPDSLPVGLQELFLIDSAHYEYSGGSFTDSFGNVYDGVHYYDDVFSETRSIFNLNGKYKKFTGSVVASTKTIATHTFYVNIYVDGVLKFSTTNFTKVSGKVDFEIDVTGGEVLKITVGLESGLSDPQCDLGIVDAQLTK